MEPTHAAPDAPDRAPANDAAIDPVYLDHNATTPLSPAVLAAMEPWLRGAFGNPLTAHRFGTAPRDAVEDARAAVLALLGPEAPATYEVTFDSGGTEALNHVVKGLAFRALEGGRAPRRRRIVIGAMEHYAVAGSARWLAERFGFEVVEVPPGSDGVVPADAFVAALDPDTTLLASLQWANNEIGTIQPVRAVGAACRARGIPFITDTVQCPGKIDLADAPAFADAVAFSAHKLYGPKGCGALVLARSLVADVLVHGARQEDGRRGGTHNVPGIVGFGAACRHARADLAAEAPRLAGLRDTLAARVLAAVPGAAWNGAGAPLLPNTLNLSFAGCPSHLLAAAMDRRGFAISQGAACRSGAVTPSHTLQVMGLDDARATSSVRVSLGHATRTEDVPRIAAAFAESAAEVRAAH